MAALVPGRTGLVLLWPRFRSQRGVYRSGKFCDQHPGRLGIWLQLAMGAALVEPDGNPGAVPVREARHRDGPHAAAKLSGSVFTSGESRIVDSRGIRRH